MKKKLLSFFLTKSRERQNSRTFWWKTSTAPQISIYFYPGKRMYFEIYPREIMLVYPTSLRSLRLKFKKILYIKKHDTYQYHISIHFL